MNLRKPAPFTILPDTILPDGTGGTGDRLRVLVSGLSSDFAQALLWGASCLLMVLPGLSFSFYWPGRRVAAARE